MKHIESDGFHLANVVHISKEILYEKFGHKTCFHAEYCRDKRKINQQSKTEDSLNMKHR